MRLAKVQVSNELIIQMLSKGWEVQFIRCTEGLPEGARFVYSVPSEDGRGVYFIMTHESFSDVEIGQEVPNFPNPVFRRYYYPEIEKLLADRIAADQ